VRYPGAIGRVAAYGAGALGTLLGRGPARAARVRLRVAQAEPRVLDPDSAAAQRLELPARELVDEYGAGGRAGR
jgi:hypothetical protein